MTTSSAPTTRLPLVLASSSPYRRELLERLHLPFISASPDIDETPQNDETPEALVMRLAEEKASALAATYPHHLIIASDQVASLDGKILTKPHSEERAAEQLTLCSGRAVTFVTGLTLLNSLKGEHHTLCEPYHVEFRELTTAEIQHYIKLEQPLDCAGSFRMEALGIALFSKLSGRDPNSLIGLPLIALCDLLRAQGINPLLHATRRTC